MKNKLFGILTILIVLNSCGQQSDSSKQKESSTKASIMEEIKQPAKWLSDSVISLNILFANNIILNNGESNKAGVSFILKENSHYYLASANHLVGPDGGFKEFVPYNKLINSLKTWKITCMNTKSEYTSLGLANRKNNFDAIFLNIDSSLINNSFPLSKVDKFPDIGEECFLLGFDPFSSNELIIPIGFTYIQNIESEGLLAFAYSSKHILYGNSGAPIVNKYGRVIGMLRGSGQATEEMTDKDISVAIVQSL